MVSEQEPVRATKHGNRISLRLTDDELATLENWAGSFLRDHGETRRVTGQDIAEQVLLAVVEALAGPDPWE